MFFNFRLAFLRAMRAVDAKNVWRCSWGPGLRTTSPDTTLNASHNGRPLFTILKMVVETRWFLVLLQGERPFGRRVGKRVSVDLTAPALCRTVAGSSLCYKYLLHRPNANTRQTHMQRLAQTAAASSKRSSIFKHVTSRALPLAYANPVVKTGASP